MRTRPGCRREGYTNTVPHSQQKLSTVLTFVAVDNAVTDIRDYNFHEIWNKGVLCGCKTSYVRAVTYFYFYFKFADVLF